MTVIVKVIEVMILMKLILIKEEVSVFQLLHMMEDTLIFYLKVLLILMEGTKLMEHTTRVIAVANSKGGSGKTATVFNLGAELARKGKKVLLWDLDPQASLTACFGLGFPQTQLYSDDILATDKIDPSLAPVKTRENLYLIPATQGLGGLEGLLQQGENILRAKKVLERLAHLQFDFVIFDPPGSTDIFMSVALIASKEVIIPVRPTHSDFSAMIDFKEAIEKVKGINPEIEVKGILFNQVITSSKNQAIYRKFLEDANWDSLICKSTIRMATAVANAPGVGKDVISFDPKSKPAQDYKNFAKEVLSWN